MEQARERIQKLLAKAGYGSRRQIENWIDEGRITVNGKLAKPGEKISVDDKICIDEKPVSLKLTTQQESKTLIYHKPEGEVCTRKDEEGRTTVFSRMPKLRSGRWINVGRLDINTSGLLLMTTDGELAHRLMHPSSEIEREYAVRVFGSPDADALKQLTRGVELEDGPAKFQRVSQGAGSGANQWFHVVLKEGRNREVRRLWEAIDCTVTRLMRVRFGIIDLPKSIRPGRWEYLTDSQLKSLYQSVGLTWRKTKFMPENEHSKKRSTRSTDRVRRPFNNPDNPYKKKKPSRRR